MFFIVNRHLVAFVAIKIISGSSYASIYVWVSTITRFANDFFKRLFSITTNKKFPIARYSENLAVGMTTPPVGLDIFMASNISGVSLKEVSIKVMPFMLASLVAVVLVTFFPCFSLWLPNPMGIK